MLVKPLVRPIVRAIAGNPTASLGSGFSPTSLFLDGSKGVVYDNNDLSSFFLDSTGATQATVNGLVGLQLDKSGNLALGADFCVNGGFDTDTVWTKGGGWAISGGVATKTPGVANTLQQAYALTVGKAYKITYTVSGRTAGTCAGALFGGTTVFEPLIGSNGARSCILIAVTGNITFGITADSTFDGSVDNFTIQELPGNHRYQTTTGSKPVLRGTPTGANLVTNGDFASGTGWTIIDTAPGTTTISGGTATMNNGTTGTSRLRQALTVGAGVYRITFTVTGFSGGTGLGTLSVGNTSGGDSTYAAIPINANGTYVRYTGSVTGPTLGLAFSLVAGAATSFVVDNVEVVDVSAGSVTAPYGLQYDGVDDFLQTASVDFTATDKMFVCAGVLNDGTATAVVAELSPSVTGTNGAFALFSNNIGAGNMMWAIRNTVSGDEYLYYSNGTNPSRGVLSASLDINNATKNSRILGRKNGVAQAATYGGVGTTTGGNFGNHAIYFGRRGGASLPYNGLDFGLVICGKTLTSTQISQTERYIAQRTGISL